MAEPAVLTLPGFFAQATLMLTIAGAAAAAAWKISGLIAAARLGTDGVYVRKEACEECKQVWLSKLDGMSAQQQATKESLDRVWENLDEIKNHLIRGQTS